MPAKPALMPRLMFAGPNNCTHYRDGIQHVGQRHQGRMEERRDPADDFEANETGQHKYAETGEQIQLHDLFPSEVAATGAAKAGRE